MKAARKPVGARRLTIGVLTPLVGGFYYSEILTGIRLVAEREGARVVAFQTKGMEMLWPDEVDTPPLGWSAVDAWISINDCEALDYARRISLAGKPLVFLSARPEGLACWSALPDNQGGTLAAMRHLLDHGHRQIAFAGCFHFNDIRERYEGYVAALKERGIEPDPALLFPATHTQEAQGLEVGRRMVAGGIAFTAVMAASDLNALGIMRALKEAGRRVPEDIAVVGFDDIELAQYMDPPLTTVRQSFRELASAATETLFRTMATGAPPEGVVRVPATFVPRRSCGCQRAKDLEIPVPASAELGESLEHALSRELLAFVGRELEAEAAPTIESFPAARRLAAYLSAVVEGRPQAYPEALKGSSWRPEPTPDEPATVEELLTVAAETMQSWFPRARSRGVTPASTTRALRRIRMELLRSLRNAERARRPPHGSMPNATRLINIALIGADFANAKDLSWLRKTSTSYACLGLWSPKSPLAPRQLEIISVFSAEEGDDSLLHSRHAPDAFPAHQICVELDRGSADDILTLLPITSAGRSYGVLTVVGPVEFDRFDDLSSLGEWAALLGASIDREGLLASLREAYERERQVARTLRESEERYALAARGANDGLWDWDLTTNHVHYSPRWKEILGFEDHELGPTFDTWLSRVNAEDRPDFEEAISDHFRGARAHVEHEYRIAHKDGGERWVLCRGVAVFDAEGRAVRAAGSQTDITSRKRAEEELRRNALHDVLTGLPNRALLVDRLEVALAAARKNPDRRFAVLFLDLDRFKNINDSLGHLAGDELLVQLARRLRDCARSTDTVARFGGDEFAVIAHDIVDEAGATLVAQRIQEALRVPFTIGEHVVVVSTSIGIAVDAESYERAEDLVRDADNAMYRAKVQGRARHEVFNTPMHEQAMARLKLEEELHRALARGELRLHYQPFVCMRRGQVIGVEALIRWQHPKQGLLAPAAFLSVVEESGLMIPMNEWVLRTACADLTGWRRDGIDSICMSVNLPSQQLGDPGFVDFLATTLREADLPPDALGLELVESSLIENKEDTIKLLQGLRDRGIRIAIDDFGTGYSSLSYLKRFPLDTLKIDRSFTQGIPNDPRDTGISTAIIAMAHSLGLTVIAEGVETQDQLEFYGARGCDMVQGHLLSPPLPATECGRFLHAQRTKTRPVALAI